MGIAIKLCQARMQNRTTAYHDSHFATGIAKFLSQLVKNYRSNIKKPHQVFRPPIHHELRIFQIRVFILLHTSTVSWYSSTKVTYYLAFSPSMNGKGIEGEDKIAYPQMRMQCIPKTSEPRGCQEEYWIIWNDSFNYDTFIVSISQKFYMKFSSFTHLKYFRVS